MTKNCTKNSKCFLLWFQFCGFFQFIKKVFSHGRVNSVEPKQFGSKISAAEKGTFSSSSSPLLKLMRRKKEFPSNKAVYGKECRRISSSPKRIILKLRFYCFTRFILPCEKTFIWIEKNLQNWNKKGTQLRRFRQPMIFGIKTSRPKIRDFFSDFA